MRFFKDMEIELELTGWWNGRAVVDCEVDEQVYEDFFDTDYLDDHDKTMIMMISTETDEEKQETNDIVPVNMLNKFAREQIFEQIMNGDMFGTVWCNGNDLQWSWDPEVTLEGASIDFQDLSDASKEYIADGMLENEWRQGEVNEYVTIKYNIELNADNYEDKNGTIMVKMRCEEIPALVEEVEVHFEYDKGNITLDERDFDCKLDMAADDLKEYIGSCLEGLRKEDDLAKKKDFEKMNEAHTNIYHESLNITHEIREKQELNKTDVETLTAATAIHHYIMHMSAIDTLDMFYRRVITKYASVLEQEYRGKIDINKLPKNVDVKLFRDTAELWLNMLKKDTRDMNAICDHAEAKGINMRDIKKNIVELEKGTKQAEIKITDAINTLERKVMELREGK